MLYLLIVPAVLILIAAKLVYNVFRPGLSNIPGPWPCKFTDAYRVYRSWRGDAHLWYQKLQAQYGDLVRVGPNTILDSEHGDFQIVFGFKEDYSKSDSMKVWLTVVNGKPFATMASTQDKSYHAKIKRPIANLYSNTNVLTYQPRVTETIKYFLKRLDEEFMQGQNAGRKCDMDNWVQYFAFDIVGQLTLSRRLGFLEAGHDIQGMLNELNAEFEHRGVVQSMPFLERIGRRNPLYLHFKRPTSFFADNSRRLAGERMKDEKHTGVDMLDGFLEAKKKNPDVVTDAIFSSYISSNFLAGSDTTSVTMRSILYYVLRTPGVLERLREELDGNITTYPPDYTTAISLKYLDSVIREALRIHPLAGIMFERVVPASGHTTSISGTKLPPGTQIGQTPWTTAFNENVWGPETHKFKPERWMRHDGESEEDYDKRHKFMMNNDFSFSYGPRACLGKHIAWMEIVEVIPTLFGLLDIQLADPSKEWDVHGAFFSRQYGLDVRMKWRAGVDKAEFLAS